MRLIDADVLKIDYLYPTTTTGTNCIQYVSKIQIDNAPTVEPKYGHWVNKGFEPLRCSECGIVVDAYNGIPWACKSFRFCPHCGADMRGEEDGKVN